MMGWITALSAYLWSTIPLWLAIIIGSVVFLLLSLALYFIARRRVLLVEETQDESPTSLIESEVEKKFETLNVQHQSKIASIQSEHAREIYGRDKRFDSLEAEISRLKGEVQTQVVRCESRERELKQYEWLHNIAAAQVNDIDSYVVLDRIERGDFQFHDGVPFVKFGIYVTNNSVFNVTIELESGSYILFKDTKLISPIDVVNDNLSNVRYQTTRCLVIEQRLSVEEVHYIASYESKDDANFYFDKLIMTIKGNKHQPPIPPKRLDINKGVTLRNEPLTFHR